VSKPPKGTSKNPRLSARVKTAAGRPIGSTRWLQRQLNDPYVQQAKADGYRSRAAFKLLELDAQFKLLKPGMAVLDLGCAPGSWTQVALHKVGKRGTVIGIDLLEIPPIPGATILQGDMRDESQMERLIALLPEGRADLVLSDMAPNTTGHGETDHMRIMGLCEMALQLAERTLKPGGHFVAKTFQGGTEVALLTQIKQRFRVVKHAKPAASRKGSSEMYLVALERK
jgi:23S rRNA (uridine2552-2'-O)-methyltransferase